MAPSALNLARKQMDDADDADDGYPIRAVYRKLHSDFHVLTTPFGIHVSPGLNRDLAHLIGAIDVVDRELDEIPQAAQRETFGENVLQYLRGESTTLALDRTNPELIFRMRVLKAIIVRREIQAEFCETVGKILEHTEAKRQSLNERQMIRHLVIEWRSTGHLTVLILGKQSTREFENFFYLACEMMPAIDTIQDAGSDYRRGQVSIRPSVRLYARLLAMFVLPLPKLMYLFPARWSLIKYTFSFLMEGMVRGTHRCRRLASR